ncbi:MAG: hypothetical protein U0Z70_08490 [Thermomicrobiales bacterium]|nr:hypothetical protein [Chloroflexia bacterium]
MEPGTRRYGVSDIVYDIVQTVGNLLQGQEKLQEYAGDAERAGDQEAAAAFRTIAEANRVGAQVLLGRLRSHLNEEMG